MSPRSTLSISAAVFAAMIAGVAWISCADTTEGDSKKPKSRKRAAVDVPADSTHRVPVNVARDRATQMHATIESTLHAMHRHYFHRERATIPARALQDVFDDLARESHVDVRWISVNTKPMSIDHEPETDFEKRAAREIASGKESYELEDSGTYRRASAIPLGAGCVSCHTTSFAPPSKIPRFAGLVISIPTRSE